MPNGHANSATALDNHGELAARSVEVAPNFKSLLDTLAALEAEFGETIRQHAARPE